MLRFTKGTSIVGVITVVDLTAAANEVFERTYDPVTPMLAAAVLYWILVNLMRCGFDWLDRALNRHLIAQEQQARAAVVASHQTLLTRLAAWSATHTEQAQ